MKIFDLSLLILTILLQFNCPFTSKREACVERNDRNNLNFDAEACLFFYLIIQEDIKDANSYLASGNTTKYNSKLQIIELEKAYIAERCIMSSIAAEKCKKESNIIPNW